MQHFFQVDLGKYYHIEAVLLQGSARIEYLNGLWVDYATSFKLLYSGDGDVFSYYSEDGNTTFTVSRFSWPGLTNYGAMIFAAIGHYADIYTMTVVLTSIQ